MKRVGSSACWMKSKRTTPGSLTLLAAFSMVAALNASICSGLMRIWTCMMCFISGLSFISQSRGLPQLVHPPLHLRRHLDHIRPGSREAFARPLSGRVDSHFRTVIGQAAGMVQRIHRALDELDVALGVDVIQGLPGDLAVILHVHAFIHYHDHLG